MIVSISIDHGGDFSLEEALIVVIGVLSVDFPGFSWFLCWFHLSQVLFLRFSGFLWAIDGPTNAVAIDPLIVVMVPGCLELITFENVVGFELRSILFFLGTSASLLLWSMGLILIQLC